LSASSWRELCERRALKFAREQDYAHHHPIAFCRTLPLKSKRTLDYTRLRGKARERYPIRVFAEEECLGYVAADWAGHYEPPVERKRKRKRGKGFETVEVNRGHPDMEHLTAQQKARAETFVWQPWSWRTPARRTHHYSVPDRYIPGRPQSLPLEPRVLIGYGERKPCAAKAYNYDRPLIATTKPKLTHWTKYVTAWWISENCTRPPTSLPSLPNTLWGEASKLVGDVAWAFRDGSWSSTPIPQRKAKRVRPSFRKDWRPAFAPEELQAWRRVRPSRFKWKPDSIFYFQVWEQAGSVHWTNRPRLSMANLRHLAVPKTYKPILSTYSRGIQPSPGE
jgi:hypothetical protein